MVIRWRKKDSKTISNLVRQFNAKITRVSKARPDIAANQPDRINSQNLQKELKQLPRSEFNKRVKSMKAYLKQGAEMPYTTKSGVNTTVWQKNEITRQLQSINAQRRYIATRTLSKEKGNLNIINTENLRPRKNTIETIQPKNWDDYLKSLRRAEVRRYDRAQLERYKENYLKAVRDLMGENNSLYETVQNLDPEILVDAYYNDPRASISFVYDPQEIDTIAAAANEAFEQAKNRAKNGS